jgi:hypothetical protein
LAQAILACVPLTDKLRVHEIRPDTDGRAVHEIKLLDGTMVVFENCSKYGVYAYLVDPNPDLSWPKDAFVVTTWGHSVKVNSPPDGELYKLTPAHSEIRACRRIQRAAIVSRFLTSTPAGAEVLKVDVYRLQELSDISSTTLRAWIDYGPENLSETVRAKLAKALGVEPEDVR